MNIRDELRSKALGAKRHFKRETVQVRFPDAETGAPGEPVDVEVIQPNVRERAAILKAAGVTAGKESESDLAELQVTAVIACAVVPGTSQKLFEPADRESLITTPAGGWLDDLSNTAMKLLNVDQKELEKK